MAGRIIHMQIPIRDATVDDWPWELAEVGDATDYVEAKFDNVIVKYEPVYIDYEARHIASRDVQGVLVEIWGPAKPWCQYFKNLDSPKLFLNKHTGYVTKVGTDERVGTYAEALKSALSQQRTKWIEHSDES